MRPDPRLSLYARLTAATCVLILGAILLFLLLRSAPFFASQGAAGLLLDAGWHPLEGRFSLVAMLLGSLLVAAGAVMVAAPAGLLMAIFGRYYCPARPAATYRAAIELLAGIPSVVYGLWGLVVLVPWIADWMPPGASVLAGIIVLALMVLPLMVVSVDDALAQMPKAWMEAGSALALSRAGMLRRVILPQVWPAVRTGTMLQTGRALGETMAVLMVCGNVIQIPSSVFDPARTLTANIALEMAYATDTHAQALVVCGLLLFLLSVLVVWAAQAPASGAGISHG